MNFKEALKDRSLRVLATVSLATIGVAELPKGFTSSPSHTTDNGQETVICLDPAGDEHPSWVDFTKVTEKQIGDNIRFKFYLEGDPEGPNTKLRKDTAFIIVFGTPQGVGEDYAYVFGGPNTEKTGVVIREFSDPPSGFNKPNEDTSANPNPGAKNDPILYKADQSAYETGANFVAFDIPKSDFDILSAGRVIYPWTTEGSGSGNEPENGIQSFNKDHCGPSVITPTPTETPSLSPTETPTGTETQTPTSTSTPREETPTSTLTSTSEATLTPTPTAQVETPTPTPTQPGGGGGESTATPTPTATRTSGGEASPTSTKTPIPTATQPSGGGGGELPTSTPTPHRRGGGGGGGPSPTFTPTPTSTPESRGGAPTATPTSTPGAGPSNPPEKTITSTSTPLREIIPPKVTPLPTGTPSPELITPVATPPKPGAEIPKPVQQPQLPLAGQVDFGYNMNFNVKEQSDLEPDRMIASIDLPVNGTLRPLNVFPAMSGTDQYGNETFLLPSLPYSEGTEGIPNDVAQIIDPQIQPMVVAGHVVDHDGRPNMPFSELSQVQVGQEFVIKRQNNKTTNYVVTHNLTVKSQQAEEIIRSLQDENMLIFLSCSLEEAIGREFPYRTLVIAIPTRN